MPLFEAIFASELCFELRWCQGFLISLAFAFAVAFAFAYKSLSNGTLIFIYREKLNYNKKTILYIYIN
jgi:hypothetical protein